MRPAAARASSAGALALLALTAAAGSSALPIPAAAAVLPEARPELERLERAIDPLRDLETAFVQVRHLSLTDEEVRATGRLRFLAPDHFRLDYASPETDVLSMRGDSLLIYFPSLNQAQCYTIGGDDAARNLFLIFSARRGRLEESFDISLAPPSPAGRALRFQPLEDAADQPISEIQVTLNGKTGFPQELFLREEGGDTILFRLEKPKTNRGLKREAFAFEPPAGTEVIHRNPAP